MHRKERDTFLHRGRQCGFVLGDNHHRGRRNRHARVLVRRGLHTPRHHKANVYAVIHVVRCQRAVQASREFLPRGPSFEVERVHAFIQAIQVLLQKQDRAPLHPQAFPHAIAEDKARIKHRYRRLGAGKQFAVDVDKNVGVTFAALEFVGAFHCRLTFPGLPFKPL